MTEQTPQDIKRPWLNVVRRLQSVANTGGLALVSITVLVDKEGCPAMWLEPQCRKIEPKKTAEEVLRLLNEEGARVSKL